MTNRQEVMELYNDGAIDEAKRDAWLAYLEETEAESDTALRPDTLGRKTLRREPVRLTLTQTLIVWATEPEVMAAGVVALILWDVFF